MNYDYYKTFVVLSQTKNFSTTAKKLNVAQSTVSNRIKELEKQLGHKLFLRSNKTVELTVAGEKFLPYSKRMISIETEAMATLAHSKHKYRINFGSVHSIYQGYLKKALIEFIKTNSDIAIKVFINHSDQLLEYLVDELIDIGIISYVPNSSKFTSMHTLTDHIILVAKNTSAYKDDIDSDELEDIDLIYTDLGEPFDQWLTEKTHNRLNSQIYVDQINEVIDFIHEGFGYAFILESMADYYIRSGSLKKVNIQGLAPYPINHYIVVNKSKANNKEIQAFLKKLD